MIEFADSDEAIIACFPVMRELRPHLVRESFVDRVRLQQRQGYRLVYLEEGGAPVAVAGFRIIENLVWGRFLYVDDLITLSDKRSRGYGRRLLAWLETHAQGESCRQINLDSGKQRIDAHRFYEREGFEVFGLHFCKPLLGNGRVGDALEGSKRHQQKKRSTKGMDPSGAKNDSGH